MIGCICSAGMDWKRVKITSRSASFSASVPGMLLGLPSAMLPFFGSISEQHRAGEALVLGEDARELRQGLLGLVLMVVGDEHDLLAFAGAFRADVRQRGIRRAGRRG